MKPFWCPVTFLNTRDYLGKFDEKADEKFFVGYSMVRFQTNGIAGTKDNIVAGQAKKKKELKPEYILIPICTTDPLISQGAKDSVVDTGKKATKVDVNQVLDNGGQDTRSEFEGLLQQESQTEHINSTNSFNTLSLPVSTTGPSFVNAASLSLINAAGTPASTNAFKEHHFEQFSPFKNAFSLLHVPIMTPIHDTGIFGNAYDDEAVEEEVDMNNVVSSYTISDAPLTKFLKNHPKDQVIGNIETYIQTSDGNDKVIKWYQEPKFGLEIWWWISGSESRPPMLNKENYVPWSSRLLRYAKSRPNGKLIHNSIINSPYVRRMILEPGDTNRDVTMNETFHVQTADELNQIKVDDQAIQTILLGLPEDIYAAVDSCETAQEIWLRVQQMIKGSDIGIQEKKAKLFNEWERQMQMIGGNGGNQFRQYTGQKAGNLTGYNKNGLIGVPGNANQNLNRNGNLVAARAEGNATGQNRNQIRCYNYKGVADLDEIKEVNENCILMANLQQASTLGSQSDKAPVYDSDGSTKVHDYENYDDNEIFNMFTQEEQYTKLLEPIPNQHQVSQNDNNVISEVTSMEQSGETVEHPANFEETQALYDSLYQNLAIEVEKVNSVNRKMTLETHNWWSSAHQELHKIVKDENFPIVNQVDARVQNFEIQFLKEAAKFVGDFKSLANEADESLAKHKALELEIKRLLKAVFSQDIISVVQKEYVVDTSDLQTELERTKERFENCIIKKENEYTKLWNDWYKKCDECKYDKISYDKAYKDMQQKIERLQAQLGDLKGMFRINPLKTSREEKHVPNTVRASTRIKPITVSQPFVFTKKDVNFNLNGLSSTGVDNTKTKRPQPSSNTKNDRVPSTSKSSRSKNKEPKVEEHHMNLLLSKNNKHMSSAKGYEAKK
nr:hypothetical protein [Tanacetum cinerariifolium]